MLLTCMLPLGEGESWREVGREYFAFIYIISEVNMHTLTTDSWVTNGKTNRDELHTFWQGFNKSLETLLERKTPTDTEQSFWREKLIYLIKER